LWRQSAIQTPGFVASPSTSRNLDLQAVTARGKHGASFLAPPDPEQTRRSDSGESTSATLLWSLVGLAFAGASLASQRRECNVARRAGRGRSINRWARIYGGDGPPTCPRWIKEGWRGHAKSGYRVPEWLTFEWWDGQKSENQARTLRWFLMAHDETGQSVIEDEFGDIKEHDVDEAVEKILAMHARAPLKYDASLEVAMVMNLDSRYPDQQLRTSVELPHGLGKKVRVAVYCPPDEEDEVGGWGADIYGKTLIEAIQKEEVDFDVLLAKPQMMPQIAKLGKILGPRRLMPSPKSGTVVTDLKAAIETFKKGGLTEIRTDTRGQVHSAVGKVSYGKDMLVDNIQGLINEMITKRPLGAKGKYWKKFAIGSCQGPSLKINTQLLPRIPKDK